jgi:hypothetical protein
MTNDNECDMKRSKIFVNVTAPGTIRTPDTARIAEHPERSTIDGIMNATRGTTHHDE